jgi:hypothetical protein
MANHDSSRYYYYFQVAPQQVQEQTFFIVDDLRENLGNLRIAYRLNPRDYRN